MNSGVNKLAPAPDQSKLQPLFRKEDSGGGECGGGSNENDGLQPFFSEGITPWGELVADAVTEEAEAAAVKKVSRKGSKKRGTKKVEPPAPSALEGIDSGLALLNMLQQGGSSSSTASQEEEQPPPKTSVMATGDDLDLAFMTDKEITARSQQEKKQTEMKPTQKKSKKKKAAERQNKKNAEKNAAYIRDWVKNLPQSPSTDLFGDFHLDVDKIINAMKVGSS